VPPRRRVDPAEGRAALAAWQADPDVPREIVATAVRHTLAELAERHPGHSVEVRVPPLGAVQCVEGIRHRRGTPPNVVETDPATWLALVSHRLTWADALASGALSASGNQADISALL
jgi:hypothetical protein